MEHEFTPEAVQRWHRWFAVECNNRGWDLAAQETRTPEEDDELLATAYAAALHWSKVGKPINGARADCLVAEAHALLGNGEQAMFYAMRCLDFYTSNEGEDWDLAFAHAKVAHAAAVLKDTKLHRKHYKEAQKRGAELEEEDRKIFDFEFKRVPAKI